MAGGESSSRMTRALRIVLGADDDDAAGLGA
jgi:hypothetical protein